MVPVSGIGSLADSQQDHMRQQIQMYEQELNVMNQNKSMLQRMNDTEALERLERQIERIEKQIEKLRKYTDT